MTQQSRLEQSTPFCLQILMSLGRLNLLCLLSMDLIKLITLSILFFKSLCEHPRLLSSLESNESNLYFQHSSLL